jgi:hypothetical protein
MEKDNGEKLYERPSQEQSEEESKERLSGAHENQGRTQDVEQKASRGTLGKRFSAYLISRPRHNKRQISNLDDSKAVLIS